MALVVLTIPDWWFFAFLGLPFVGFAWLIVPVVAAAVAAFDLFRRRYQRAVLLSLFPIFLAAIVLYARHGGDRVWFALHHRTYERVVAELAGDKCSTADWKNAGVMIDDIDCGPPLVVIFEFGGFLSMWHGVVYDQSDEFVKSPEERSNSWYKNKLNAWLSCSAVSANVGNHFYLASGSVGPCG